MSGVERGWQGVQPGCEGQVQQRRNGSSSEAAQPLTLYCPGLMRKLAGSCWCKMPSLCCLLQADGDDGDAEDSGDDGRAAAGGAAGTQQGGVQGGSDDGSEGAANGEVRWGWGRGSSGGRVVAGSRGSAQRGVQGLSDDGSDGAANGEVRWGWGRGGGVGRGVQGAWERRVGGAAVTQPSTLLYPLAGQLAKRDRFCALVPGTNANRQNALLCSALLCRLRTARRSTSAS